MIALGGGPDCVPAGSWPTSSSGAAAATFPTSTAIPAWTLAVEGVDPRLERVHESLLTLADGRLGTRGAPLFDHPDSGARGAALRRLRRGRARDRAGACPDWTRIAAGPAQHGRRSRAGSIWRPGCCARKGRSTSLRFSSLARPGTVALRAQREPGRWSSAPPAPPGPRAESQWPSATAAAAASSSASAPTTADEAAARAALAAAEEAGFERLLREHREAWARRWQRRRRRRRGRPGAAAGGPFRALPPDGLGRRHGRGGGRGARPDAGPPTAGTCSGTATCSCCPSSPRRIRRPRGRCSSTACAACPPPASWRSRSDGSGARFAWESAADGRDVTPSSARLATGELVAIRTGELEEHIVGDVAWAAAYYLAWTGDEEFAAGPGRELFVETARYWASRVRSDRDGRAHIYGVIGPDEYHEPVDDNAFTNVLARWNLRRAAALDGVDEGERKTWLAIARLARRRLRPGQRPLRAVRRLLRARAARDRGDRPAPADRRRPAARRRSHRRRAGAEAGGRADAPPPAARRGRRPARSTPTSTSTSRGPRTAARSRRRSTRACSPAQAATGPRSSRCGSRPGWTSTI